MLMRAMRHAIRNETSLVLVIAVLFSAVAIPVLSGFLEPSQPPAVAAVQIGDPQGSGDVSGSTQSSKRQAGAKKRDRDDAARARGAARRAQQSPGKAQAQGARGSSQARGSSRAPRTTAPATPAPAPSDDAGEDDGDDED
jgi:hypothetical protein